MSSSSFTAITPPLPSHAPSSHTSSLLPSLPDEIVQLIFECFTTFDLLVHLQHSPPCKAWSTLWHHLPAIDLDLERDVGHRGVAAIAGISSRPSTSSGKSMLTSSVSQPASSDKKDDSTDTNDTSSSTQATSNQVPFDVSQLIARKRADYTQFLHLIHQYSHELQVLHLDNFGTVVADVIASKPVVPVDAGTALSASAASTPTAAATATSVSTTTSPTTTSSSSDSSFTFESFLAPHAASLMSLSLVASSLRRLRLSTDFTVLESVNLSKCRSISDLFIHLPELTSLDLSRTLLNDYELLKIIPNIPKLRILRVIGCKNLRKIDGDQPRTLFASIPDLEILDLSTTKVCDVSVNSVLQYCTKLRILFLNDCFDLRSPRIISASLETLSMRSIVRLRSDLQIECDNLRELDLSKTNLRDEMISNEQEINSKGFHFPKIEILVFKCCYELLEPKFRNGSGSGVGSGNAAGGAGAASSNGSGGGHNSSSSISHGHHASSSVSSSSAPSLFLPYPSQSYPNLHTLDFSQCVGLSNRSLYELLSMTPNITSLNLQQCTAISSEWKMNDADEDEPEKSELFPQGLMKLQELCMRGTSITDENVMHMMGGKLNENNDVSNSDPQQPQQHISVSNTTFTILNFRNCKITGEHIRCVNLVELDLRLSLITDSIVTQLLVSCPALMMLYLGQCEKLVAPVITHSNLQELDLSSCNNLRSCVLLTAPTHSLRKLDVSRNTTMQLLDLKGCLGIEQINIQYSQLCQIVQPEVEKMGGSHSHTSSGVDILTTSSTIPSNFRPPEVAAAPRPLYAYATSLSDREYSLAYGDIPRTHTTQAEYELDKDLRQDRARTANAVQIRGSGSSGGNLTPLLTNLTPAPDHSGGGGSLDPDDEHSPVPIAPSSVSASSRTLTAPSAGSSSNTSPSSKIPRSSPTLITRGIGSSGGGGGSTGTTIIRSSSSYGDNDMPLHSTNWSRASTQAYANHVQPVAHSPSNRTSSSSSGHMPMIASSPPRSPQKRPASNPVAIPSTLSPAAARIHSTAISPVRHSNMNRTSPRHSPHSSAGGSSAIAASAASSTPAKASSSSSSSATPLRGIRSIDLCITESRILEYETKLAAGLARLQQLTTSASAGDADQQTLKSDLKLACYGFKKQLAVHKAKLKQEQKMIMLAQLNQDEPTNSNPRSEENLEEERKE